MTGRPWHVAAQLRADVGEGPAWDGAAGVLWFVDVTPGVLYRLDVTTGGLSSRAMGLPLGAAIPSSSGGLVLALEDGLYAYAWGDDAPRLRVPVEADDPSVRMNDAACDPRGRLWAGTMAYDYSPGRSTLYRFDASGPTPVLPGCTIANGTGWSPDASTMYFVDTPTGRIDRLDYDIDTGRASGREAWVSIDADQGSPDGLTVDSQGCVWVALWGGGAVHRYDPSGRLLEAIRLPARQVSSVCFGGSGLTELFVTSAAYRLTVDELADQPLAGSTFVVSTDVVGLPTVPVDAASIGVEP
jgi:sugar lactone lactonase YvrE